jgi:hypothetical protein
MALNSNEIVILKSASVRLDESTIAILTYMYHAEKTNRALSFYKYVGRVISTDEFKREIREMNEDENRLKPWKFPHKSLQDFTVGYDYTFTNHKGAMWGMMRLEKLMDWDSFIKLIRDGVKVQKNGKVKQNDSSKYAVDEYITEDGVTFNIDSPESLLAIKGKCFEKDLPLKRTYNFSNLEKVF